MIDLLKSFYDPAIKNTVEYINSKGYYSVYYIIAALVLVFSFLSRLIPWLLGNRKTKSETVKIDIETKQKQMELIEKIRSVRTIYTEKISTLMLHIRCTIDSIGSRNEGTISSNWTELHCFLFSEFVPSFINYLESFEVDVYKNNKKKRDFIDNEIFRLFKTVDKALQVINHSNILNFIHADKVCISKEGIIHIINFVENNILLFDVKRRRLLNKHLKCMGIVELYFWGLIKKYKE